MNQTPKYVDVTTASGRARAFVPPILHTRPAFEVSRLLSLLDIANQQLSLVAGMLETLPESEHFLRAFSNREALFSSQIEGSRTTFLDLLLDAERLSDPQNSDDQETLNCAEALILGSNSIKQGMPVSIRLIRELHQKLFATTLSASGQIGEFRRSQNWLGGNRPSSATYVPPPPHLVKDLMSDWERFYNAKQADLPVLLKIAIAHAQFEQIHPFLDGNGRIGRILIALMLGKDTALANWRFTLSLYFKTFRDEYYTRLQDVSENQNWEDWLAFFLHGIVYTSNRTMLALREITELFRLDLQSLAAHRVPVSTIGVYQLLQQQPVLTSSRAKALLDASGVNRSMPTIRNALKRLEGLGIVDRVSSKRRTQAYQYTKYIEVLAEGTEPL